MRSKGFTLLETMIVVCIIGILASVSFAAYRSYVIRTEVSEAFNLATTLKPAIVEYWSDTGRFPDTVGGKIPGVGKYVKSVELTGGVIVVTFGREASRELTQPGADQLGVTFGPSPNGRSIVFVCGRAPSPIEAADLAGDAAKATTVPTRYLPKSCQP